MEALRRRVPGVDVQFDPVTGSASHVMAAGTFLTGPAVADAAQTVARFVEENAALFGHPGEALTRGVRVTREDVTAHNGMRSMVWQQEVDGVPVYQTILRASLTRNGELLTIGSHFLNDAEKATQLGAADRSALVASPPVTEAKAVVLAAANLKETVDEAAVQPVSDPKGAERRRRLEAPGLSDVNAGLAWLPVDANQLVLAWDVTLMSRRLGEMFRMLVDVKSGEVLVRTSLTCDLSDASYRVHANATNRKPLDSPQPLSPGHATPQTTQPPVVARSLITLSALNPNASPDGWITDGGTKTYGNNVDSHLDLGNTNPAFGVGPHATAANRVFDFPMDLTQAPSTYRDAAVTSLFYLCNWYHDQLYDLGFTESAGNFQKDNFGRGGNGNDAVLADAQDGGGTNNANFSTPPDGSPGRMQMYLFSMTSPGRDGSVDAEVVFHEFTHGLSNRLVGGGVGMSALQSWGMGEGWSDFYGLALLSEAADDPNGNYAEGGYLTGDYYKGIRNYPYTTDIIRNPLTLKLIDPSKGGSSAVHFMGQIWCVTLWEARANLIAKHGWAVGNQLVLQLVTDGMKLSPVNPTFLQARDAILQADLVNNAGANLPELWRGFAKRGMGASAVVPASSTSTGVTEAFDMPDELSVSGASGLRFSAATGSTIVPALQQVTVTNTDSAASVLWIVAASQPWISVSPPGGVLAPGASVNVTVVVNAAAQTLAKGVYTGALSFTNLALGTAISRTVELSLGGVDSFTELFDASPNDTSFQSWLFTPDSSPEEYRVDRTVVSQFPSDPAGGSPLFLSDDESVSLSLSGGQTVKLYGTAYSSLYVGANGYLTFGSPDTTFVELLSAHFAKPRIAGHFNDLLPSAGGAISWKQWSDRAVVTYQNVPKIQPTGGNSFQIEMYFDGRIRITCLGIGSLDGLIGLSKGAGIPVPYVKSDFSAYGTVPPPTPPQLSLTLPATVLEGSGVLSGAVAISAAQPAATAVALSSTLSSKLQVPANVTIPAGATSVPFEFTVPDNSLLDGAQSVIVTATAAGIQSGAGTILVRDNEAGAVLSISAPVSVTEGGPDGQGTVSVNSAPSSPVTVSLTSSQPADVWVPASVVIPAGQTSAVFLVTAVNDTLIDGTQTGTLTAHVEGWTDGSVTVAALDNETRTLSLSFPTTLTEGNSTTGTVTSDDALPTPITVALVSSNVSRLTVPASVTIPAGNTSASFALAAPNNTLSDGPAVVNVTANGDTFRGASRSVTVIDDEPHHFTISTIAPAQVCGAPFSVTVTAKDVNDAPLTQYTRTVSVAALGGQENLSVTPGVTTAFANGVWTGSVTVNTSHPSAVLKFTDAAGGFGQSNPFNVGSGTLDHFAWSPVGASPYAGQPIPVTLTAQDKWNNTVTAFSGAASIAGSRAVASTVVGTGTTSSSSFPLHTSYHDERSQCIYLQSELGAAGTLNALTLHVSQIPGQMMNNWTIRVRHTTLASYPTPVAWENTQWTTVYQSNQTITATGPVTFNFTTPFEYDGVRNLMVDFSFNNSTFTTSGAVLSTATSAVRSIYAYTNSGDGDPLTWSGASPAAYSASSVPNLKFGRSEPIPVSPVVTGAFSNGVWQGNVAVLAAGADVSLSAQDAEGRLGRSNAFSVGLRPPSINGLSVTGVGATSATLGATINPHGAATVAAFQSGPTTAYGNETPIVLTSNDGLVGQTVGTVLTGLTPGTSYHFRVTATNPGGTTTSSDMTFATLSNNALLSDLGTSGGTLSPAFSSEITDYTITVPNGTTAFALVPVAADPTANLRINGSPVASGVASAPVALSVGANTMTTVVTAQDGVTERVYSVRVLRAPSSNAELAGLALSSGALSPVFSGGVTQYTASVPHAATSVTVTPAAADATASVRVNGAPVSSGSASSPIALTVGINQVSVVVTAQDQTTVAVYTVSVRRAPSSNADLAGLALSSGTPSPVFSSGVTQYMLTVPYDTLDLTATPTAADATASVKVNGAPVASGTPSAPIPLQVGMNTINVVVTAQDAATTLVYTVSVTRTAPSANADLSALVPSAGTLSPVFNPIQTSYTLAVPYSVESLRLAPGTVHHAATMKVNGAPVASGTASGPVALTVGANPLSVVVTAEDTATTKTYTLVVTRAPVANDASLAGLTPATGELSPVFDVNTTSYRLDYTTPVLSTRLLPVTRQPGQRVTVNGKAVASGKSSADIALPAGVSTISVVVTAPDRKTRRTYTVEVRRPAIAAADLSSLKLSVGSLSPAFSADTTQYSVRVPNTVTAVKVTAEAAQPRSAITVGGVTVPSGRASAWNKLAPGENAIAVVLTAEDGVTTKTYTLQITRQPGFAGTYDGVAVPVAETPDPGSAVALVGLSVSRNGAFTGKLLLGGRATPVPLRGVMDVSGVARFGSGAATDRLEISTPGRPPLTLSMQMDVQLPFTRRIVGTFSSNSQRVADFVLNRRLYSAAANPVAPLIKVPVDVLDPSTNNGRYTALFKALPPADQGLEADAYPQGDGWAVFTVRSSGAVSMVGELADGQAFTYTNCLSQDRVLPFYVTRPRGGGSASGRIFFRDVPGQSDADAVGVRWFKRANNADGSYPQGWPGGIRVDFLASKFLPPALTKKTVLGVDPVAAPTVNALLLLNGGGTPGEFVNQLSVGLRAVIDKGAPTGGSSAPRLQLRLDADGKIAGQFRGAGPVTQIRGAVFQKNRSGHGYFLTAPASGGAKQSGKMNVVTP